MKHGDGYYQAQRSTARSQARREADAIARERERRLRSVLFVPALIGAAIVLWQLTAPMPDWRWVALSVLLMIPYVATHDVRL